jgi:hypothetical protein
VAGKNEKEAADNFLSFLHETLSCVTAQPLTAFQQSKKLYKVWFNPPAELTTRSGARLFLSFTQVLGAGPDPKEPGEFKVSTREYSYRLLKRVDVASEEILAYHWHPNDSELRDPHLHIRSVARVHFPTSRVCLEDFIYMLINYYGVTSRKNTALFVAHQFTALHENLGACISHSIDRIILAPIRNARRLLVARVSPIPLS